MVVRIELKSKRVVGYVDVEKKCIQLLLDNIRIASMKLSIITDRDLAWNCIPCSTNDGFDLLLMW